MSTLGSTNKEQLLTSLSAKQGDLILFAVGPSASVNKTLDRLRTYTAYQLGLIDQVSVILLTEY